MSSMHIAPHTGIIMMAKTNEVKQNHIYIYKRKNGDHNISLKKKCGSDNK